MKEEIAVWIDEYADRALVFFEMLGDGALTLLAVLTAPAWYVPYVLWKGWKKG